MVVFMQNVKIVADLQPFLCRLYRKTLMSPTIACCSMTMKTEIYNGYESVILLACPSFITFVDRLLNDPFCVQVSKLGVTSILVSTNEGISVNTLRKGLQAYNKQAS